MFSMKYFVTDVSDDILVGYGYRFW